MVKSQFLQVNSSSFLVKAKSPFAGQLPIWYHILYGLNLQRSGKTQNTQVLVKSNFQSQVVLEQFDIPSFQMFQSQVVFPCFPPLFPRLPEELLPAAGALMTVAGQLPAPDLERFWDAVARQLEATRPEAGECVNSWEKGDDFNGI